jgi:hypothetical protein
MIIDVAYVAAAAVTVAYAAIGVGLAFRGGHDVLRVMAARAFALAVATAVAAALAGRLLGDHRVTLAAITTAAVPFGVAAAALHALAARHDIAAGTRTALNNVGVVVAIALPFAAGLIGWA